MSLSTKLSHNNLQNLIELRESGTQGSLGKGADFPLATGSVRTNTQVPKSHERPFVMCIKYSVMNAACMDSLL